MLRKLKLRNLKGEKIGGFKNTYGSKYIYKIRNYVILILNIYKQSTIIKLR